MAQTRAPKNGGVRAAVYTRISSDPEGRALGVERQAEDCRRLADREGLRVVDVFEDNDVSASTRSTKRRPAYERMLRLAESGAVDVLLFYSTSRLTRRPVEYERLISLVERHGTRMLSVASGPIDLGTADGRYLARTLANADAAEAERTSERVARAARQRAEKGHWHGGWAPCGYRFTRDAGDRITGLEPDPVRAPLVVDAARRIVAGDSVYRVVRDLNDSGVPTAPSAVMPEGTRWSSQTLKRAVTSPAVVGKRELDGELVDGLWPAIMDEDLWHSAREVLSDPARTDPDRSWVADPRRKNALSGLLKCGGSYDDGRSCGHNLVSQPLRPRPGEPAVPSMVCSAQATGGCGHVRAAYEPVETWVLRQLVARLDSDEYRRAQADADGRDDDADQRAAELRAAVEADRRRVQRLQDQLVDDLLDEAAFRRQRDRLNERVEEARAELARIATRPAMTVTGGQDLADRLAAATPEVRRALLGEFIERVEVGPFPVDPETGRRLPTTLTRKKTESEADFDARRRAHAERVLAARVSVRWRV